MMTQLMKKASETLSARVTPIIKQIIRAEVDARGLRSETDFLELAILQAANSPEARRLMLDEVKGDPKIATILAAFKIDLPANESPKKR